MPVDRPLHVLKFGGTSVGTPERLAHLAEIVAAEHRDRRVVVVVSALGGVTDQLVAAADAFAEGVLDRTALVARLHERHHTYAADFLGDEALRAYDSVLHEQLLRLVIALGRSAAEPTAPAIRDEILALGERLAAPLVAALLRERGLGADHVDAAALIRTDAAHGQANVDLAETRRQVQAWYRGWPKEDTLPVVTGFIGSTEAGVTTTLGRGGSDYSAALLSSALGAAVFERWTDVDGIYTDDPRTHEDARRLSYIVLEEAWAWNHAGRLGMHRKALDPLVEAGVPVHVRSTATPEKPGTWIVPSGHSAQALAS